MFGNFLQTFGLDFPLQQADAQGGLLGLNAPVQGDPSMGTTPLPSPMAAPGSGGGAAKAPPTIAAGATPPPAATPQQPQQPQQSPLASPLAPGQSQLAAPVFGGNDPAQAPAPAAGVGSQFSGGKI